MTCSLAAGFFALIVLIGPGVALAQQGGSLTASDEKFVTEAAEGGQMEVALGELAAQKATSDDVRQFARRVADDHPTASTGSWRRCAPARTACGSCRCVTRRPQPSWPAATRSSPGASACAWPLRARAASTCSTASTMLMAELATCVKYRLPVKIVVVKNGTLGQIKWEQMVFLGNPEYGCELQPIDFALFAEACGATGITIENPGECGDALDAALATPGPVVVQAVVDPLEPPMPAKVTVKQMRHFAESLLRGEPNRQRIALTVLADRVRELI